MTREDAAERVGIPGFLACRIFRALSTAANRYFILYELDDENIVTGAHYLARLNAPTPWSQRIMPRFDNFARSGGRIKASAGIGQGGIARPCGRCHSREILNRKESWRARRGVCPFFAGFCHPHCFFSE